MCADNREKNTNGSPMHNMVLRDNGKALINPNMGWTMHFYSNSMNNYGSHLEAFDTVDDFPGLSTVYLRIPWIYVEPEEGVFNWEVLDTPAQRWIQQGKRWHSESLLLKIGCIKPLPNGYLTPGLNTTK